MTRRPRSRRTRSFRYFDTSRRSLFESLEQRLLLTILVVDNPSEAVVAGQFSLRQAVAQAETDAAAGTSDTITFDANLGGQTIDLTQGDLELASTGAATITINGSTPSQPVTISESSTSGAVVVDSGAQVVLENLVFNDCTSSQADGGAILNAGTLTASNTVFSNDAADSAAQTVAGGAIANTGSLTLTLDTFSNDTASSGGTSSGGALATSGVAVAISDCSFSEDNASDGGAIASSGAGTLTLNNDTFSGDNSTLSGNAIYNLASTLTAANSTFSGNDGGQTVENDAGNLTLTDCTLTNNNGAVQNDGSGTTTITDSSFDDNTLYNIGSGAAIAVTGGTVNVAGSTFIGNENYSGDGGGAIGNAGGTVKLVDSTFYQNTAYAAGGAIDNSSGTLTLADDTVYQNDAYGAAGGGVANSGTFTLQNSIVAGNSSTTADADVGGSITSDLGNNLLGTAADNNSTLPSPGPNDLFSDDPGLSGSPGNYGGPTQTLALLTGSPAIGAGNALATNLPSTDQRGLPRVVAGSLDIGAFQTQAPILAFTTLGQTLQAGDRASITLVAEDLDGQPVVAGSGGLTVNLASTSVAGTFFDALGNPLSGNTITIPSGASSVTFEYSDTTAGSPTISASASGYTSVSQQEGILPAPITATPSTDIVVGRTLSAYYTADVQNNQVTITLTVYNQSSNSISGVLLTDTLEAGVTLVSATQQPDQSGQNLAWSLGTIEGDDWASVTITVSLANSSILRLDSGAQAYAMLNGVAISNVTPAATLTQGSVDDNLLVSTADANTSDPYIQEEAAALDYNPQNIFNFLQDNIGYNAYQGSLRGARGTLWSSAGNSLDVASLGVALMRASGIPAQYEEGTLSYDQAAQLILSMFPNSYQTVGYVPSGTTVADPADDPTLQAETQDHFWFQFESGGVMVNADPLMAGAAVGQTFTTAINSFVIVPQSLEQTTEIQLTAEIYSQADAVFSLSGNGLTDTVVLDQTFNDVSLVGVPVTVGNLVSTTQPPALAISSTTNTYTPYIDLGDEALPDDEQADAIIGTPYQEVLTSFPLANQVLTGLFLNVTLAGGGTTPETYSDTLVDRIGYAARQGLAAPGNLSVSPSDPPIITPFDLTTLNILPGLQSEGAAQLEQERANQVIDEVNANTNPSQQAQAEALTNIARANLASFAVASDQETANLASGFSVAAYFDAPRIAAITSNVATSGNQSTTSFEFDLIHDSIRAVVAAGQNVQASLGFAANRGVFDSFLEAQSIPVESGAVNLGSASIIQQSVQEGIPLITIGVDNLASLQTLGLPADALARISTDVQSGLTVVVPTRALLIDGTPTTAWWVVNPTTGEIISEGQNGGYGSLVEFSFTFTSAFTLTVLNLAIGFLVHDPTDIKGDAKDIAFGLGGAALPFAALGLIASVALTVVTSPSGPLNQIDPPVGPLLDDVNVPYPDAPGASIHSETAKVSSQASGLVSGNLQASSSVVSGNLSASWQSGITASFLASSLGATATTVVDSQGAAIGSGTIGLSSQTPTPVSISGNSQYSVEGNGSLSLYGSSVGSLGVSGNWSSYSATVTGTVSITMTVSDGALTLNGQPLPAGTYTITTTSVTLAGSGQTTSPNFSGSVAITASNGTVNLGPGTGNISSGGNSLDPTNGVTLDGYAGTINVSANGDGTDAVTLDGNSTNVLSVSATPNAITTEQNTPVTFATSINTSLADTYTLTASAPVGWTVTIDNSGNVTVTPAPGLQDGTYPIQITAQSNTDPNLVANAFVNITITPTLPGMTLALNPDPVFSVPYDGAQLPTAYRAVIQNTGPTADTYNMTFHNVPAGFTVLDSTTSVTIPAGATGIVGVYLQPDGTPPAPGTPESFSVTATSVSDSAITQTATITFDMPTISAITVTDDPTSLTTTPGVATTTTLTITNVGNVAYDAAISPTLPSGWTISGEDVPVSLALGASTTETVTITPPADASLNTTQNVTLTYGPAVATNTVSVVGVTPNPATVEAGTSVDVQASIVAGMTSDEEGSAGYTVTNSQGTVVFTSAPVPVDLPEVTGVTRVNLGSLGTIGLATGQYTIQVTIYDSNNNPIAGATGQGTLLIGAPITVTQSLNTGGGAPAVTNTLAPGSGSVSNTLNIAAQGQLGEVATDSMAASVVTSGNYAYLIGAADVTIVDVSNPADPTVVGTFGTGAVNAGGYNIGALAGDELVVASGNGNGGFSFLVYSLTNPTSPTLLGNTTIGYEFPGSMFIQGTTAYLTTTGFGFSGAGPSAVTSQFGDFLAIDFSNAADPVLVSSLANSLGAPEGGNSNVNGAAAVSSQLAYVVGSTSTGSDTQSGSGQLQVVDVSNPASPSVTATLAIPNSVQAIGLAVQGSVALVVGTTGGWESPANDFDFQLSGNITLTLLDISNPASPTVLTSMIVRNVTASMMSQGTLNIVALGGGQFAISDVQSGGSSAALVVDASNPASLSVTIFTGAGGVSGMAASGGLLLAATAGGLDVYQAGSITALPVTVTVQVPTTTGVSIVPGSFNVTPSQDTTAGGVETLVWDFASLASIPTGGITWESDVADIAAGQNLALTLGTTIAYSALGSTTTVTLPPLNVAGVPEPQTLTIPVTLTVPGAVALGNAAAAAEQVGNTNLANQLNDLVTALTNLETNPTSAVYLSQAEASLASLVTLTETDVFLASYAAALNTASTALAAATDASQIDTAIGNLGTALNNLAQAIEDELAHGFTIGLQDSFEQAQPGSPDVFDITLTNTGTQTTTYDFSISGLPSNVTAVFSQPTITLAPGQSIPNGPTYVTVSLSESGTSLSAFNFVVTATATEATEITAGTTGQVTLRQESLLVGSVTPSVSFTTAGNSVDVSAAIQSAVNVPRSISVSYVVTDANGDVLSSSSPVTTTVGISSTLTTLDLGSLNTTGFANGNDTITVTVVDTSSQPLPSASGQASLLIGLPVSAALSVSPPTLPEGSNETVTNTLTVSAANVTLSNPLTLDGNVQTDGTAGGVAIDGTIAYVVGSEDISIVDISNPASPQVLSTFGGGSIVANGLSNCTIVGDVLAVTTTATLNANQFTLLLYSLTNPDSPQLLSSTAIPYQFAYGLFGTASTLYVPTNGVNSAGGGIIDQFGSFLAINISNPAAPQLVDELYNDRGEPEGGDTEQYGGTLVNSQTAYVASSTSTGGNVQSGEGQVLVVNVTDPASMSVVTALDIPGTVDVLGVAIEGDQALVVGSTGGWAGPGENISGNITLTVVNITNPLSPQIIGTTLTTTANIGGTVDVQAVGTDEFVVSGGESAGNPSLLLVDTSDPSNIVASQTDTPVVSNRMVVDGGVLYVTSSQGLTTYNIGTLTSVPYTVTVEVPNTTGVAIDQSSFNTPPTKIVDGATYDTIEWSGSLAYGSAVTQFTWQSALSSLAAGQSLPVTLGGTIEFTSNDTPGSLNFAGATVSGASIASLIPTSLDAQPGATATYDVRLFNPTGQQVTYEVVGYGESGDLSCTVNSGNIFITIDADGSVDVPLAVTSSATDQGKLAFEVEVFSQSNPASATLQGNLDVSGSPLTAQPNSYGVSASLSPTSAEAGQGDIAQYLLQVTNTGSTQEQYNLQVNGLPGSVTASFNSDQLSVTPGSQNFEDDQLQLAVAPGTPSDSYPFSVVISAADGTSSTTIYGTLTVSSLGVQLSISPSTGAPNGTYELYVYNTGTADDTYSLSLAGPAAVVSSLGQSSVVVPAGSYAEVPITVGAVDFAIAGSLELAALAVSQTDASVQGAANAQLTIPATSGLSTSFSPASATLSTPGSQTFTIYVNNLGNSMDSYTATISGTTGNISASLLGLDGQSTQSIPLFELPGLASGALQLNTVMSGTGEGTVTVTITDALGLVSQSTATVQVGSNSQSATVLTISDDGGSFTGLAYPATVTVNGDSSLENVTPTLTYYAGTAATGSALSGAPSTAGTYMALANFAGSTDYSSAAASTTFTITKAQPGISVSDSGGVFNGSPFPAQDSISGVSSVPGSSLENVTQTLTYYSGTAATGSALSGAPSTAGTYTALASFAGSTDYSCTAASTTFTITKAQPGISVSDSGGLFNGSPFPARDSVSGVSSVPGSSLESVTPTLTYYSGTAASGTGSSSAPSTAGTYTALASFAGSTDYNSAAVSTTFTVTRATPSLTVTDAGGVYKGSPYAALDTVNGGSSLEGSTPTLAYYTGAAATGTPSSSAPAAAGTYTVLVSFAGSTDYASALASTTFTIAKAIPTVSVTDAGGVFSGSPFPATATVNGGSSLEGVSLTLSYYSGTAASGTALSLAPTAIGTYTVVTSFAGSTDYSSATAKATFTIRGTTTPTLTVTDTSGAFDGSPYAATDKVNGGSSLEGVSPTLTYYAGNKASGTALSSAPSSVGTYSVLARFAGSTDYTSIAATAIFSITKATPTLSISDSGGPYTGLAYPATDSITGVNQIAGSSLEGVTTSLTYYSGTVASGTPLAGAPSAIGTYTALASFAGSTDYTSAAASVTFTIALDTINFQNERVTGGHVAEPLTLSGFEFTSTGTQGGNGLQFQGTGDGWPTTVLASEYPGTVLNMTRVGGGTFTLYSLVLDSFLMADSAVVTGYNAAGTKIDQQIVAFNYGKGAGSATSTASMNWTDLSKITITWWSKSNGTGQIEDGGLQSVTVAPTTVTSSTVASVPAVTGAPWQNPADPLDVAGQGGAIVPLDALEIIDYLNANPGNTSLPSVHPVGSPYYDVTGTNSVVPLDALEIINYLNANPTSTVAAEPAVVSPAVTASSAESDSSTESGAVAASSISASAGSGEQPTTASLPPSAGSTSALLAADVGPGSTASATSPAISPAVVAVSMTSATASTPATADAPDGEPSATSSGTAQSPVLAVAGQSADDPLRAQAIDAVLGDTSDRWLNA